MMPTLDDLSASLPNGFHDAELQRFVIDYTKREAQFIADIWIGDMNAEPREAYRLAEVTLSDLLFWISEPPDAHSTFDKTGGKRIDIGPLTKLSKENSPKLPPVPYGSFVNWIFLSEWNSFIYVAAQKATLKWLGEKTVRKT